MAFGLSMAFVLGIITGALVLDFSTKWDMKNVQDGKEFEIKESKYRCIKTQERKFVKTNEE